MPIKKIQTYYTIFGGRPGLTVPLVNKSYIMIACSKFNLYIIDSISDRK